MECAQACCPNLLDMCDLLYWCRCKDSCLCQHHPALICRCRPSRAAAAWIDTLPPQFIFRQMLLGPWWPSEPCLPSFLSLLLQISNPPAEIGNQGGSSHLRTSLPGLPRVLVWIINAPEVGMRTFWQKLTWLSEDATDPSTAAPALIVQGKFC